MATAVANGLGVRFWFDSLGRVATPARARISFHRSETWGLRNVSFDIGPGESVALLGATGSGKTTLLRALAGVVEADEGSIAVEGRRASMLSIDAGLIPSLTGGENGLLLSVLAGASRAQAKAGLGDMKERSGLGEAFDRPASTYSQGMLARLAFTAATECDPEVILLDEVHEAFDHSFRDRLRQTTEGVLAGGGILVAAGHDHDILARLCDRAFLVEAGRIAADGPFDEVRERYLNSGAADPARPAQEVAS
jgi:ABC-type polysaccharide/polyol phosphate transport system ATPase subunit